MDFMDEINKLDLQKQELLATEIEQIQVLGFDFLNAHKAEDVGRRDRIFKIFLALTRVKSNLPTLQEYFGGKNIGYFIDTIDEDQAVEYILAIVDKVRVMADFRVKPEPFI